MGYNIPIRLDGSSTERMRESLLSSDIHLKVSEKELMIMGIPSLDKLEYVARNTKNNLYVVVHRPKFTTDERYIRLHIGSPDNLSEPLVTKACFDGEGFSQIYYRFMGECNSLWIRDNTISVPLKKGAIDLDRLFIGF